MNLRKNIGRRSLLLLLPAWCLMFISCGKKPISSDTSNDVVITPELSRNLSIELAFEGNANLTSKSFMFEEKAHVSIPEKIFVKSGSPSQYEVKVYFNTNYSPEQRDANEEFYCSYRTLKVIGETETPNPDGYYHKFEGCFEDQMAQDNHEYIGGYDPGKLIPMVERTYLRVDLVGGYSKNRAEIFTEFLIDWY